jgi:hypothetical protein
MHDNEAMNESCRDRAASDNRRHERRMRLRLAFLEGAEQRSRDTLGRALTNDELRRVIGRFPAVVSDR